MEEYLFQNEIGSGSYGNVYKAINKKTFETVAIKKLKKRYTSREEILKIREYKCLRYLVHSNVIFLKKVVEENNNVFLVYEYMESSLYDVIKANRRHPLSQEKVRKLCFQMFVGLDYIHKNGYLHRDIKPENMLVTNDTIKIADFGLSRRLEDHKYSIFPALERIVYSENKGVLFGGSLTGKVGSRWYSAPEILLRSTDYTAASDMWSMGLVMAHMFLSKPLFQGTDVPDQLNLITQVFGTPNLWPEGLELANSRKYMFPQFACGGDISTLIPSADHNAIHLIKALCCWNPKYRPTADEVLSHPYFTGRIGRPLLPPLLTVNLKTTFCPLTAEELMLYYNNDDNNNNNNSNSNSNN